MIKSEQTWIGMILCTDGSGVLTTPTVGPAGTLYIDGVINAAVVTVTGSNPYKWSVTLPSMTAGQTASVYMSATIGGIATAAIIAEDIADTVFVSDIPTAATVADAIWDEALSGHTSAGTAGDALGDVEADIWGYASRTLTQTAASVTAAVTGSALAITRGDTFTAALTGLGSIATRSKLWFAVKTSPLLADTSATLFLEETAGLTVVSGTAYTTTTNGTIVVDNETTGAITITVKPAVTSTLTPAAPLYYEVQVLTSAGVVTTLTAGECRIEADVIRVIA